MTVTDNTIQNVSGSFMSYGIGVGKYVLGTVCRSIEELMIGTNNVTVSPGLCRMRPDPTDPTSPPPPTVDTINYQAGSQPASAFVGCPGPR